MGENYSPGAFLGAAKNKVKAIVLLNVSADNTRCAAAIADALSIPASSFDSSTGNSVAISHSSESVADVCTINYEVPHPNLLAGQYYVLKIAGGLAIEGEQPVDPLKFPARIREMGASAIVLRKPAITELLCFGAVATAAQVHLLKVKIDGTLAPLNVTGGSVGKSCSD